MATLERGRMLGTRGSNRPALRTTSSAFGWWANLRAMPSDQAAFVLPCAFCNYLIAASVPSGTTENQPEIDDATPLLSSQIDCGEKPRPVMRYSVSSPLVFILPALSMVASPTGNSRSL